MTSLAPEIASPASPPPQEDPSQAARSCRPVARSPQCPCRCDGRPRRIGERDRSAPGGRRWHECALEHVRDREAVLLVVEDETEVRDVVRTVLERHGYRVLAAGDASEALAIATAHPASIDLLLTDVVLPGRGGLGPHAYLAKPFTLDGLARKVREALDMLDQHS